MRWTVLVAMGAGCAAPAGGMLDDDADLDALTPADHDGTTVLVGPVVGGADAGGLAERVRLGRDALTVVRALPALGAVQVEVPADVDVLDAVRELRASGRYAWVEPNLVRRALTVNDPYFSRQWHMAAIDVETAWATTTGAGATVAVVDSGVSSAGSDTPVNLTAGWDFVDGDSDPTDLLGHGTHVAGTIAQATDNGVGVAGVAYDAEVLAVRVLDRWGSGTVADIADGIVWAVDNGADVVNLSLGASWGSSTEQAAVQYADAAGVVVVAAAGNTGRRGISYPARYSEVIAVGATDARDARTYYSSWGNELEIMAPGGDLTRDDDGDGYADGILQETFDPGWGYHYWEGTSMAAPHVSGVAALLVSLGATAADVRSTLQSTAVDMGPAGWDSRTGYGLLDAGAAVASFAGTGTDADGDGWTVAAGDCVDSDPSVHPGATETWYDGVDQDCDGASDYDADADGYDSDAWGGSDCDDADSSVNPGATEVCGDGIDQDCDGSDATCSGDVTPPAISGVWTGARGSEHLVRFFTDEDATAEVCDDLGNCATTPLGTAHRTGWFTSPGSTFTITATDAAGNSSTYGPASW